jgi:hypothetical protein
MSNTSRTLSAVVDGGTLRIGGKSADSKSTEAEVGSHSSM